MTWPKWQTKTLQALIHSKTLKKLETVWTNFVEVLENCPSFTGTNQKHNQEKATFKTKAKFYEIFLWFSHLFSSLGSFGAKKITSSSQICPLQQSDKLLGTYILNYLGHSWRTEARWSLKFCLIQNSSIWGVETAQKPTKWLQIPDTQDKIFRVET